MAHSNQIREFVLTAQGIKLRDVCTSAEGVLTGSMREMHEARQRTAALERDRARALELRAAERKRKAIQAQIHALQEELAEVEADSVSTAHDAVIQERQAEDERHRLGISRRTQINGEGKSTERIGDLQ
jgi:circadian clock protein KaiC